MWAHLKYCMHVVGQRDEWMSAGNNGLDASFGRAQGTSRFLGREENKNLAFSANIGVDGQVGGGWISWDWS